MTRVTLLHVSDLHFGATPLGWRRIPLLPKNWHEWLAVHSHEPNAGEALLRFLSANASRKLVDVLVISGDLATTGDLTDLDAARDFVDGFLGVRNSLGKSVLTDFGVPVVLIPGNHDRYIGRRQRPGGTEFDAVFNSYWNAGQRGNGVQELWNNGLNQDSRVVLLGADLTLEKWDDGGEGKLPGSVTRHGRGRLYQRRRVHLENQTRQIQQSHVGCTVVWVVHFEPHCGSSTLKLINEKRLLAAAERCGVQVLLCGHSHRSSERPIGRCQVSVCGTTTQAYSEDGNHFHVVTLDVDPPNPVQVSVQFFRFDPQIPGHGFVRIGR